MAEIVHVSQVRIHQDTGVWRRAYIGEFTEPVVYGMHGGLKKLYGVMEEKEAPATLDHIVAAVAA